MIKDNNKYNSFWKFKLTLFLQWYKVWAFIVEDNKYEPSNIHTCVSILTVELSSNVNLSFQSHVALNTMVCCIEWCGGFAGLCLTYKIGLDYFDLNESVYLVSWQIIHLQQDYVKILYHVCRSHQWKWFWSSHGFRHLMARHAWVQTIISSSFYVRHVV